MMVKKHAFFIINPIAGGKGKKMFAEQAEKVLDLQQFTPVFRFTEAPGHASQLAREAVINRADVVVAVGGDGTINEVASALVNQQVPLGIIPEGSGNGLAFFLGIPADMNKAVNKLNQFRFQTIDSGDVNGKPFFNMAGIGFDALVSHRFAGAYMRGPLGYLGTVLTAIGDYRPQYYELKIDGVSYQREAFMISIANSPQYGNNAYIAPAASVQDGWLDVCIIRSFPMYQLPGLIYRLFNKTADQSAYVEIIKGKAIEIIASEPQFTHLDGEAGPVQKKLNIGVNPASLRVIC